ncbi:DegT/DnrJ/EryC1/StrS family aminotransferase [Geomonas sp. RF6]|uniref:DegT/DnrJ/EryC1/StrS family aminotransferase n=1 Tax=Geomonas sp. RF6 TaxID=2897342 RepID=UPI001E2AC72C|nr:DegT/DnrJ/EryC1/StrS family aminotransferase [Geomonas sp. RF6]UFS69331.1 DegT/DnrJ/EryC1/StrS family aminotransferase [Geomonas sp. RF6]
MTPIPFFALDRQFAAHRQEIMTRIELVLASGKVLQGEPVTELEEKVASLCGRRYGVALGSCTDALAFALTACGVGEGDEVLVTAFSFIASASCIARVGAVPVFVDIDPHYYMMDLRDAASRVTPRTRCLIAVHLFGQCLDMNEVERFASTHGLRVIEDAAQSFGSSFAGRRAGSMGDASCISFDPTKVIGAFGSGGMLLTDSPDIAATATPLRYHGKNMKSGAFEMVGYNSQMPSEHASLLSLKVDLLGDWIKKREEVAARYLEGLAGIPGVGLPKRRPGSTHNWHKFVIRSGERGALREFLRKEGIETMVHYPTPLDRVAPLRTEGSASVGAQRAADEVLSLPIYPELREDEVSRIINTIRAFFSGGGETTAASGGIRLIGV